MKVAGPFIILTRLLHATNLCNWLALKRHPEQKFQLRRASVTFLNASPNSHHLHLLREESTWYVTFGKKFYKCVVRALKNAQWLRFVDFSLLNKF